jgi:hypothetical protein
MSTIPSRLFQLFDYNGYLAQSLGSRMGRDEPVQTFALRVSNIKAAEYPGILGMPPWDNGRPFANGVVYMPNGRPILVNTESWPTVDVRIDVPKPRDGKTYTWRWAGNMGEWIKDSFPLCECRESHNPTLPHCGWCGKAQANMGKHRAAYPNTCGTV